jgi:predicted molibdopterin-dependent oxidoreductase YjgC
MSCSCSGAASSARSTQLDAQCRAAGAQRNAQPDDAPQGRRDARLADGQTVRVSTATGAVEVLLEVTEEVVPGSVCYPHGFGHSGGWQRANALPGININLIASSRPEDWEQVSGNVHVDGFPVRVEAA